MLATQYLEEAERMAERMAIVDRGKVVVEGTPEGLKAELRGDSVEIDFVESPDESVVRQALERIEILREIVVNGSSMHARADHGASAVPVMLSALDTFGDKVASVQCVTAT